MAGGPSKLWLGFIDMVLAMHLPARRRHEVRGDLLELWAYRQALGRTDLHRASMRDLVGLMMIGRWRDATAGARDMWNDARYAVRTWMTRPAAAVAMVLTLALGIGASTSIFTAVDALLLRPLAFPSPEQLVHVTRGPIRFGRQPMVSPSFVNLPEIASAGVWAPGGANLELGTESQRISAAVVDDGFFQTMGVNALVGDVLPPSDGVSRTVVVAHELWRTRFGGDRALVGGSIVINGHPYAVAGVMPPGFTFPADADVWIPPNVDLQVTGAAFAPNVVARIAAGVSLPQASAAAAAYDAQVRARQGAPPAGPADRITLEPLTEQLTRSSRPTLVLLAWSVGLLLLVVCASVANILLARVASRTRELMVRRALGASGWRLMRQSAIESVVLTGVGGFVGVLLAMWSLSSLRSLAPEALGGVGLARMDARVLMIALAVSLATAVILSVAPALAVSAGLSADVVRAGRHNDSGRRWWQVRSGLIIAQMAMALVLLSASTAMVQALIRVSRLDLGFGGTQAVAAQVTLPVARYGSNEAIVGFIDRVIARVSAAPGVRRVAVTGPLPGDAAVGVGLQIKLPGAPADPARKPVFASRLNASQDYFTVMGTRVLAGRGIAESDRAGSVPVVVLSAGAARQLFPTVEQAVGARVEINLGRSVVMHEVVGVVADVYLRGLDVDSRALSQMYFAAAQSPPYGVLSVVAEVDGEAAAGARAVQQAVAEVDANVPTYGSKPVDSIVDRYLATRRLAGTLVSAFAMITLIVAAIGLYGLMSQLVAERHREIGIRLALGASARDVRRRLIGRSLGMAGIGALVGAATAAGALRGLSTLVPSLQDASVWTLPVQSVVLLATALVSAWWPASRVLGIDPAAVLRQED